MAHLRDKGLAAGADLNVVTSWAQPRFGALSYAAAPAQAWGAPKKRTVQWSEPEPWIVAVLLLTGVAVVGRHPIARLIGTEVDDTAMSPSVVATGAPAPAPVATSSAAAAAAAAAAPVPTHAPRDPFHELVKATGSLVDEPVRAPAVVIAPPGTLTPTGSSGGTPTTTTHHKPATPPPATTSCTGTTYTVQSGDSLWSIAASTVKSGSTAKINVVWHRIYDANKAVIGSDPSLLRAGTQLCLPG